MSDSDRTTTGRGVLVLLAIAVGLLVLWVGIETGDSLLSYLSVG